MLFVAFDIGSSTDEDAAVEALLVRAPRISMIPVDADRSRSSAEDGNGAFPRGGVPYRRRMLFHLLKNRIYVGEIVHGDGCSRATETNYPGCVAVLSVQR